MSLAPRLDLRQSQSLVMTPQLQQAIRLLALSNLEIEGVIAEEIERNPLLEGGTTEAIDGREPVQSAEQQLPDAGSGDGEGALDIDGAAQSAEDAAPDRVTAGATGSPGGAGDEAPDLDAFANPDVSLADHLMAQAGVAIDGADAFVAAHLIDQIDEAGYLTVSLLDVADRLGVPLARVERVLARIQTFDPTGVGARNLAECLMLQAIEADRYDPCMAALIGNLDLLARGDLARLRRICDVDEEDMADMVRELRAYDPKPGCRYGGEAAAGIVPDVFVTAQRDGWAIELNAATLPRVLVNTRYHAQLTRAGCGDKASRAWLGECLASANWLVKALDQRQRTILRVASEIVKQQDGFFRHGVQQLRPLTLARVADAIDMHESTVSRVTSNKYVSCARGTFELKYFFTSAISAADGGEAVSAEAVRSAIRALIAGEAADAILSDDTLVDRLRERGFDIARRTVAKYREGMGIGSSVQRRRQRAIGG